MSKKDVFFTVGLALLMGVIWGLGELVTGMWIAVPSYFHIVWFAAIVVIALVVSTWHAMKEDKSQRMDPKVQKYEKKMKKYNKKK